MEGLQQIADLVTRDRTHVPPGTQGVAFGTGNLALSSNGAGRLPPAQPWTFRWGLATMPRGAGGADVCLITNDWAILKGTRNPEGAWRLLEWFSGDEGQKILADEDTIPANLKVARQSAYTKLDADSRRAALRGPGQRTPPALRCPAVGGGAPLVGERAPRSVEG